MADDFSQTLEQIKHWVYIFAQYTPLYFLAGMSHYAMLVLSNKEHERSHAVASVFLGMFSVWAFMTIFKMFGWNLDFSAVVASGIGSAGAIGFYHLQRKLISKAMGSFYDDKY